MLVTIRDTTGFETARGFETKWAPKMIVFDKDGTLGDCTPALSQWCHRMTNKIRTKCLSSDMPPSRISCTISRFHDSIGWDASVGNVVPSAPLAAATWGEIVGLTTESLSKSGLVLAENTVQGWHTNLGDIHSRDPPLIEDLPSFMQYFKRCGILIAVCTSDDRASTDACIQNWKLEGVIDYSICGDEVQESKPSAQPLLALCNRAGCTPRDCIVVGDTNSDTGMGKNSGAGLVVGVLTGSGTERQLLDSGAHLVLPNIGYLKTIVGENCSIDGYVILEQDIEENVVSVKVRAS